MSEFLTACGAARPLQWAVERRGSADVQRLSFDRPFLIVGRSPESDLQLAHPEVSDRHAYLQILGGRLFCADLGSREGIYVDGRCVRAAWIDRGATVRIGPYRIRLLDDTGESGPSDPVLSEPTTTTGLTLSLAHRSIGASFSPVERELMLLGRSADCQAQLLDLSVAEIHCALIQTPEGSWLLDLLGQGGVAINGTVTRLGRIAEGDELRIGDSLVRLRSSDAEDAEPVPPSGAPPVPARLSTADLVPLLSALDADRSVLAESLLGPLTEHFAKMQQHMFDRLQQAEHERFRALAAFQGEQFAALREELEQLRELRQEVDDLRSELKKDGRSAAARTRLGSASPSVPRDTPQALTAPEPPKVLRMSVSEAS